MWTNTEISILKAKGAKFPNSELLKELPGRSTRQLQYQLTKLGILKSKECLSRQYYLNGLKGFRQYKIDPDNFCPTPKIQQLLTGSIFGDGSIKVRGINRAKYYVFYECHGLDQLEYLKWKLALLNDLQPSLWVGSRSCAIQTPHCTYFKQIHNDFYGRQQKKNHIPHTYAEELDLFGLMIWYLDDGSCSKGQPAIGSKLFGFNNLFEVCAIINHNLDLSLQVRTNRHMQGFYHKILFHANNRNKLFPTWRAMADSLQLPKCMYYKFGKYGTI